MTRWLAIPVSLAVVVSSYGSPLLHLHAHAHSTHSSLVHGTGLSSSHGHLPKAEERFKPSSGGQAVQTEHFGDDDAVFLAFAQNTIQTPLLPAVVPEATAVLCPVTTSGGRVTKPVPRSHGPPNLPATSPRAPPLTLP